MAKLAIALGVLSTMVATTAAPSLARSPHVSARSHHSQQYQPRGPYAQQPFGYRTLNDTGPRNGPPASVRPFVTWDPYGQRWDSAE